MKFIRNVLSLLLLCIFMAESSGQIVEGTPCTATCIDVNKSSITGRQPNQNGVSPNLNLPCGSGTTEDNPAWWIIRPSGNKLTFSITTSNCVPGAGGSIGVQMTIWEGDNCGSVTAIDCVVGTSGILTTSVSPCKVYYLQIDGLAECQCNVICTYDKNQILKEVPPAKLTGPMQICKGASAKFNASLPSLPGCRPDDWKWTIEPASAGTATKVAGSPDDVNIKITNPPANGKVKVCAEPVFKGKCLPKVNKVCVEVEVLELKPATCKVEICPEERPVVYELINCIKTTNPTFSGTIKPETYVINFPPGTKRSQKITYSIDGAGCQGDVTLDINVFDNKPVQLPPVILCDGEKQTVKGIQFSCADAGNSPKKFVQDGNPKPIRCDTTFEVLVQCIKITPRITGSGTLDCSTTQLTLNAGGAGTLTLPNSINLTSYTGVGTREYKWSKDGVELAGETNAKLLVTQPGLYEVTLSYTYEITQKINGVQGVFKKTCFKTAQVQILGNPGTAVAETPIAVADPCAGDTTSYYINPDLNAQGYKWSVKGGATIVGPDNDPTKLVVKNNGSPYQVCLVKNACNKTSPEECITVTPIPPPVKPVLTVLPVCQGDSVSYEVGNPNAYSPSVNYSWKVSNGVISSFNADSSQIYVKWSSVATSGSVTLIVTERCGKDSVTANLVINSLPEKPQTISGKRIVCLNETASYTVNDAAFASGYQWYLSGGGTITPPDTSKTININWTAEGVYQLCVKSVNKCRPEGSDTLCINIEVKPIPKPSAGTDRKVCSRTTTLRTTISQSGNTGRWSLAAGAPGVAAFANRNRDSTAVAVTQCGVYNFIWTESNGICSASDTVQIRFSEPPTVKNFNYTCNAVTKKYFVTIELEGCDAPFRVASSPYLDTSFSGNVLTILNIPKADTSWSVIVSNDAGCNITIPVLAVCNCETLAGEMDLTAMPVVCEFGGQVTAKHKAGTEFNDGDDTFAFVLHEGNGGLIQKEVARNKTGTFGFDAAKMQCGKTYYISYVMGNAKNGFPDPLDKCLQVTPVGQPVMWDCKPKPNAGPDFQICGLSATMAAALPKGTYTGIWKGNYSAIDTATSPTARLSVSTAGVYTFWWVESNGICKDSSKVTVTFIKSDLTTSNVKFDCDSTNDNYDVTFTINGGKAPYYVLDYTTGAVLGTVSSLPYTYTYKTIPNSTEVKVKITDSYKCDTIEFKQSHFCPCTTSLGQFSITNANVCVGTDLTAKITGSFRDGNDIEEFLFADGCDLTTSNIIARNNSGVFSFNPQTMECDKPYKLIAVIGNKQSGNPSQVDLSDKCLQSSCRDVLFICNPNPTVSIVSVDSCALKAQLKAEPGKKGKWTIGTGSAGSATFSPNADAPQVSVTLLSYGKYTFVWTEENNGCTASASVDVTIKKKGDLSFVVDTLCSSNAKTYQLRFTLSGAAPYALDPGSTVTGTFNGNQFTTDAVNSGSKIKVCFTDALVCNPVCGEFEPKCPCLSNAGRMVQSLAEACVDGKITVNKPTAATGLFLDSDDTGEFFLHTGNGANRKLGTVIAHNATGEFTFTGGMVAEVTYYVSYVVGDKSSTNASEVDLNDNCVDVSLGQPIVFHALPTTSVLDNTTICKGSTATLNFTFTGKSPFDVQYTANGSAQPSLTAAQTTFSYTVKPDVTTTYLFGKVTDGNGCSAVSNKSIEVRVNNPVSAGTPNPDRRLCFGTDVTINLEGELNNEDAGGSWSVSPSVAGFNSGTATFRTLNAAPGTYTFTYLVRGAVPCPDASQTFRVIVDPNPVADAGRNQDLNCDTEEVTLGGNSSVGPSIEYQWVTVVGDQLSNTKIKNPVTRKPGTFGLEVRDNVTKCFSRDTVDVTRNIVEITGFKEAVVEPSCFGEDNGTVDISQVTGGTPPFRYSINNGPYSPYRNFLNLKAGVYTIGIKDAKGCPFSRTVTVTQPAEISVSAGDDVDVELGQAYTIVAKINFADSLLKKVTWAPACDSCLFAPKTKSLSYKAYPLETTLYTVTVVNKRGCTASDNVLLRVNKPRRVYIPNIFYPDSDDDRNRKLKVFLGPEVLKVHYFRIYDRWGNAVFEDLDFTRKDVSNQDKGWDGFYRGQKAVPGVYTYGCLVEFIDGYKEVYKGDVLLIDK